MNNSKLHIIRGVMLASSSFLVFGYSTTALAEDVKEGEVQESGDNQTQGSVALDEIVVTARRTEENLLEVPISISVVSGESLERVGIQQLGEAVQTIPGVSVTPTPVGDLLFIRGIGSGENQGFEMSVGTFVDGLHFGRGRSSRHAFLDVDRIEVLRGPQPVFFGKNTIGGALNITTRRPTDTFEASVEEYIEPEFSTFRTTGILSGPLSDTLRGRVVFRHYTSDGYIRNAFLDTDEPARDEWVGRATLEWDAADNLTFLLKGEYGESDMEGGRAQITRASPTLQALIAPIDPNAEFELNYTKSGPGVSPNFNREFDNSRTYNASLSAEWDTGPVLISSLTGFTGYSTDYAFDSDFTPLDFLHQVWRQEHETWSQEIRFASTNPGFFEYQAGVYFSNEQLDSYKTAFIDFSPTPAPFLGSGNRLHTYEQETETWSVFAEGTFNIAEDLSFIVGYRYTDETKTLDKTFNFADLGSTVPNAGNPVFSAIGLGIPHAINGLERSTDNHSLALTARYTPGDMMFYASYTQGFKAGGFDEGDTSGDLDRIIFDDENVDSYEVGMRAELLNRRLRTQLTAFYSEYDNLQVSIFDGVASLIVGNAASARSMGIEAQAEFAATNNLTVGFTASFLDSEYSSYTAGPCSFGLGVTCDLSGKNLPYAPDLSGALSARWEDQFANGWTYILDGQLFHSSSFFTAGDLDPAVAQGAFTKINATLTFLSPDEDWSLAFIARNLTDKVTAHFGDDIPLSNILGNNYQQYVDPPRTFALQVSYRFR
ncbi:TonB-dependent receptor [Parasphingorhabdus sp.]|uniref:TonB-dependent receptor n=1 Tax=Parasphingorhabdus sp. TaxID=2709688 RepID=UPI003A8D92FB